MIVSRKTNYFGITYIKSCKKEHIGFVYLQTFDGNATNKAEILNSMTV